MSEYKKTVEKSDEWSAPEGYGLHSAMPHPGTTEWTICIWRKATGLVMVSSSRQVTEIKGKMADSPAKIGTFVVCGKDEG